MNKSTKPNPTNYPNKVVSVGMTPGSPAWTTFQDVGDWFFLEEIENEKVDSFEKLKEIIDAGAGAWLCPGGISTVDAGTGPNSV